jgi:hypothetical protein
MRFGLPPHPLEIKAMNESWRVIKEYAARADILIMTHYHFDHFDPTEPLVLNGKVLLMKHPDENINAKQRERARELIRNFRTLPRRVEFVDNNGFDFGGTAIRFSPAVPHGRAQRRWSSSLCSEGVSLPTYLRRPGRQPSATYAIHSFENPMSCIWTARSRTVSGTGSALMISRCDQQYLYRD